MGEWKEDKLGNLLNVNQKSIGKDFTFTEIEYLDTGSITLGKIENFQNYSVKDAPSRARRLLRNNDIIYSTVRPIQRHYGIIKNPKPNTVVSTGFAVLSCNQRLVDPHFIYYFLTQDDVVNYLDSVAEGSTSAYPSLTPDVITDLEIILPELPEQQAIASIFSSLDDKIDLLHRQNKTLEHLAETLFRQWFVEEADESWESDHLGNIFDVGIGRTPPRKEHHWFSTDPSDVKWISIKDMNFDGIFIYSVSEYLTKEAVEQFNVPIIPSNCVILSFKMTIGRLAITTSDMLSNEAIAHFIPKAESKLFSEFLYLFLKTYKFELLGSTSSIVESINSQMIKEMEIIIPDEDKLKTFRKVIKPYFAKIKTNQIQIRTLTQLRDTLLPKLMSGEVRVK